LPEAITGENVYVTDRIKVGNDERLQESRMREIRTSGLTRGSSGIGKSRPLLSTRIGSILVFDYTEATPP
jgi:hypothetical protein